VVIVVDFAASRWRDPDTDGLSCREVRTMTMNSSEITTTTATVTEARAVQRPRFDPMSGTWPMVFLNVVVAVALSSLSFVVADALGPGRWRWPAFWLVNGIAMFFGAAIPLRYFLVNQQREAQDRERLLLDEAHHREFGARVARGLEMADNEAGAHSVADRALASLLPSDRVDVLIADSSRAHLGLVTSHAPDDAPAGCDVLTPAACPAVRRGHTLHFEDSRELDACPRLAERTECGAVCVPVSIMGSTVGVVHIVHRPGRQPSPNTIDEVETVAIQLGARVGLIAAMSQTKHQADTDPLTGLANRRRLENDVRELVRNETPFALVLADLDHFKQLNDAHGHEMGDRALRLFARVMLRNVRDGDLVARYGGEEFVIVCPRSSAAAAADAFDRIRLELAAAVTDGRTPPFTVSAGVVDTSESQQLEDLIGAADVLLLRAKTLGRDQVLTSVSL
jgi:diguanylate cyclase (GGDEF)-like protein